MPVLQIDKGKLVKTTQFSKPSYVGDPINALRIFNEKEVDEIVIVDIGATRNNQIPDLNHISMLASECFMPLCYGGGINSFDKASAIFECGVEKVILGTAANSDTKLLNQIAKYFGVQSVTVSADAKKNFWGRWRIYVDNGRTNTNYSPVDYACRAEANGAGELLLQNIDREGTGKGYDLELIEEVSGAITIPLVALGGASSIDDFFKATKHGADAVAAGNMFIYNGPHKAVLINYPTPSDLVDKLHNRF